MRKQRVVLKHGVDRALVWRQADNLLPEQADCACSHVLEPGDQMQESRLAAARRAKQREELVVVDCQIDLVQGYDTTVGRPVNLADVVDADGSTLD